MRRFGVLALSWVLLGAAGGDLGGKPRSLSEYLRHFISEDDRLATAKVNQKIANQDLNIAKDYYTSSLVLGPTSNHRNFNITNGLEQYERRNSFDGTFTQSFPTGTELEVVGQKFFDDPVISVAGLNARWQATLTQSMYRNSFGSQIRKRVRQAENNFKAQVAEVNSRLVATCREGIGFYLDTFARQQRFDVIGRLLDQARETYRVSKKAYNRRLLQKIDWLAVQSDLVDIESQRVRFHREYLSSYIDMHRNLKMGVDLQWKAPRPLADPGPALEGLPLESDPKFENSVQAQALTKKIAANTAAVEVASDQERSDVSLGVTVGHQEGQVGAGAGAITDYSDDFVRLSLNFEIPVINKTISANVAKAQYERRRSEIERRLTLREQRQTWQKQQAEILKNTEQLALSQRKVKLFAVQVKEASRLLSRGRIEYPDYARYRDNYLQEQMTSISLQQSIWSGRLDMARVSPKSVEFCKGFL